jgi:hypothetical protein
MNVLYATPVLDNKPEPIIEADWQNYLQPKHRCMFDYCANSVAASSMFLIAVCTEFALLSQAQVSSATRAATIFWKQHNFHQNIGVSRVSSRKNSSLSSFW